MRNDLQPFRDRFFQKTDSSDIEPTGAAGHDTNGPPALRSGRKAVAAAGPKPLALLPAERRAAPKNPHLFLILRQNS